MSGTNPFDDDGGYAADRPIPAAAAAAAAAGLASTNPFEHDERGDVTASAPAFASAGMVTDGGSSADDDGEGDGSDDGDDYSYDDSGLPYDYDYGASFVLSYDQPFIINAYHNNTHNAKKTTLLLSQQRRTKTSACQTKWPRARDSTLTK